MKNSEWLVVSNQNEERNHSVYYLWPSEAHFYFAEFCFPFQLADLTLSLWAPGQGLLLLSLTRMGSTDPRASLEPRGLRAQSWVCHHVAGTQGAKRASTLVARNPKYFTGTTAVKIIT